MAHEYIVGATVGLFIGISLAFSSSFSSLAFVVSFVLCILNFLIYKSSKPSYGVYKQKTPILLSILFLSITFGILYGQVSLSKELSREKDFQNFISQRENFSGYINDVKRSESSQQFILNLKESDYKLKIITPVFPKYTAGQELEVKGQIETENVVLPDLENGVKSFDIKDRNKLMDIDGQIAFPKVSIISEALDNLSFYKKFFISLENTKNKFVEIFKNHTSYEVASLSAGTTLGDSSIFAKEDLNIFRKVGLSHIIVLSGFNITILILILASIFLFFNFRLRLRIILTIISILIFILFVGAGASIIRAGLMGTVLLIAIVYGRQYLAKQALFLSTIFILLWNPRSAVSDVSFHLSFLATFAILYLTPILDKYKIFKKYKKEESESEEGEKNFKNNMIKNILEIFKVSLVVQIMIFPYLMFVFGKFSLAGIILNILILPVVPIVMLFAGLIILFFYLFSPVANILGYIAFIFSKYVFVLAEFFSKFSFTQSESNMSPFSMFLIYFMILFFIYFEKKRQKIKATNKKVETNSQVGQI